MNERLEQIRQRLQAATPGPWRANTRFDNEIYIETGPINAPEQMCRFIGGSVYPQYVMRDATFIAHAPEDVAWLLEQLERAAPPAPEPPQGMEQREGGCWCRRCDNASKASLGALARLQKGARFIVCPDCGNKRCPKATDHTLACTNSNEPGQAGSVFA